MITATFIKCQEMCVWVAIRSPCCPSFSQNEQECKIMLITDYGINIGGSNIRSDGVLKLKNKKKEKERTKERKKRTSYMENLPRAATASSNKSSPVLSRIQYPKKSVQLATQKPTPPPPTNTDLNWQPIPPMIVKPIPSLVMLGIWVSNL